METHLQKFPDHRSCSDQDNTDSARSILQSFSALKTLSVKTSENDVQTENGSTENSNNLVASPTPGTQASEAFTEPSMPMETKTTSQTNEKVELPEPQARLVQNTDNNEKPEEINANVNMNLENKEENLPINTADIPEVAQTTTAKRGRSRGRGRWRGRGRGRGGGVAKAPPPSKTFPPPSLDILEKVIEFEMQNFLIYFKIFLIPLQHSRF